MTTWRKSRLSTNNGSCVEISEEIEDGHRLIRDSKNPEGGVIRLDASSFAKFLEVAKAVEPDDPAAG